MTTITAARWSSNYNPEFWNISGSLHKVLTNVSLFYLYCRVCCPQLAWAHVNSKNEMHRVFAKSFCKKFAKAKRTMSVRWWVDGTVHPCVDCVNLWYIRLDCSVRAEMLPFQIQLHHNVMSFVCSQFSLRFPVLFWNLSLLCLALLVSSTPASN